MQLCKLNSTYPKKKKKKKAFIPCFPSHYVPRFFSLSYWKNRGSHNHQKSRWSGVVEDNVHKVILLCTRKSLIVLRISFSCFFIKKHLFFLSITLYQPCRWIFNFSLVLHSFVNLVFLVLLFTNILTCSPILSFNFKDQIC